MRINLRILKFAGLPEIILRGFKYEVQHGLEIHGTPVSAS